MKIGYCGTCDDPKPKRKGQITDKMRLDWLQRNNATITHDFEPMNPEGWTVQVQRGTSFTTMGWFSSARKALDTAIKSESKGGKV